jgi:hypothetical protein
MKVGILVKLKKPILGNKAGTIGVVYYNYSDGFQAIFQNGEYDGFSTSKDNVFADGIAKNGMPRNPLTEAEFFLQEVGFAKSIADYEFKNVMQLSDDFRRGTFNKALKEQK